VEQEVAIAGYVYLVTNLVNGKLYVGCTKATLKHRWVQHLSAAKKGSPLALHAAIRKYGAVNFTIERVETVKGAHADLMEAEIRYIAAYKSASPLGYNLTSGGDGVDLQVPGVYERMLEGARKRSASPEWLKHTAEAAARRAADPLVRAHQTESARKLATNPEWLAAVTRFNRDKAKDPAYQRAHAEAMHKRSADPAWQEAHQGRMLKRASNTVWRDAVKGNLVKGRAAMAAKTAARDALYSAEELDRRIRNRDSARRSRARKKKGALCNP
jgi:group I intron endonuclease